MMRGVVEQTQGINQKIELIQNAVLAGQIDQAELLAGENDMYLLSVLVQALYKEGYVTVAKERLSRMDSGLLKKPVRPFLELSYIWAEICYDEGRFAEAAPIFEEIASQSPVMASARYGAASCYLQEAMYNLQRRIELYHPPQAEQEKIYKYIRDYNQALHIIQASGWHTEWSSTQAQNLPLHKSILVH
ncbi:tetratricopeptide repeat protein [Paenibacillus puldeungensis]|uniref:Tetratricopeptide repeat protein n=1 Tax=Paenibacillus puldeungensis TaxID=696536 RepID=A0ABW3RVJ9_9BACL